MTKTPFYLVGSFELKMLVNSFLSSLKNLFLSIIAVNVFDSCQQEDNFANWTAMKDFAQ